MPERTSLVVPYALSVPGSASQACSAIRALSTGDCVARRAALCAVGVPDNGRVQRAVSVLGTRRPIAVCTRRGSTS
eukprot:2276551-Rhodomonas_salina.6